ncbi:related to calcium-independent phospholipase A2 [Phialocephala subalpina]|uniref:Related to calcium-independent phospholipase A2 n=1 Tax=Phialocephala subalpina TaxID=576137 RepID=A0A1L7XHG6_9HELO|nr:related to calcium-independent phospholipase A2 [Phialocephala subalpina]
MGSAINLDEIKRFEVTEVYSHPDAKVDIVFVHGLNGDPRQTWTSKNNGAFWPSQLLPVSLKSAQARILVYGYNADVYTFGSNKGAPRYVVWDTSPRMQAKILPSSDMIHQHAQTMLKNLASERTSEEVEEHPIIFVAHSLGGILVKRALELSHDLQGKGDDNLRSIYVSTFGVIFLGTPHNGADPAKWGIILQGMVDALIPKKILSSHSQLVKTLQANNETLQNINLKFLDIYPNHLKYFGIEATHSGMCKFDSKNSPGYTNVSVTLKQWVQEEQNWEEERILRQRQREGEAAKILGIRVPPAAQRLTPPAHHTPVPSSPVHKPTIIVKPTFDMPPEVSEQDTPYFIKPSGFRPNSLFVGREAELADMHRMLFDKKRRAEGTSAVLIQSLPGGGKTHLAREYVYQHKDDFPGGIFWLRAKSETELAAGFWDIACKAALKNMLHGEDMGSEQAHELFIKQVRKWLEHRHEWLMVLDGIHFSHGILRKFIPDSKNTSLIYTSTEKSVIGDHHFMNPQIMKLPLLSAREAQKLLLLELGRQEPFHRDDMKYSMELVQSMGFLPVVIHAVAQRLKSTGEPLSKFAKAYSSEPRLRGLGTYTAVVDQLKALPTNEALNLIHLLCFFSQHIPVEMISLGLRALDVSVKVSEPVTGQSLNNTFKILNTFALIDRNEHDPPSQMHSSQSSKDSRDMLADNIDVIRLHSVVQAFFVDTLHAEGTLPVWLDRAVRVFSCSYDIANERIARKHNTGRVEDYRLYEIHGKKLQEHLTRYNSRHIIRGPIEDANIRPGITRRTSKHLTPEQKILMVDAQGMLAQRLLAIQVEIERRTTNESNVIAEGRSETFQASIFDRTSSSSDTGPETPGSHDKFHSNVSTWGLEPDKGQLDSPEQLTHDYIRRLDATYKPHFPMPMPEDPGYDTDNEESVAMTVQPSQRTMRPEQEPENPASPGGWEEVRPRKPRAKPEELPLHRTIRNLERSRYSDSAGAYRAMISSDPRAMKATHLGVTSFTDEAHEAHGYLQNHAPRDVSRGRMSSQSSAEAALNNISQSSPAPARGGGAIRDRRQSSTGRSPMTRGRMMTGTPSYARAVANPTPDTASSYKDDFVRSYTEPQVESSASSSTVDRPQSSAIESLQRFPIEVPRSPPTSMPPYPSSSYTNLFPSENILAGPTYSQENLSLGPDPYPSTIYPRLEGLPPVEVIKSSVPASLHKADEYSQTFSGSLPASMQPTYSNASSFIKPDILSLSSPNIKVRSERESTPYYPGHPEFSNQSGGYTSQPMSRDPSGQSAHTTSSQPRTQRPRRASFAETEPMPRLPNFSPRIPPTSYQVYERMRERGEIEDGGLEELRREREMEIRRERERLVRKSPRLEFARAALIERLDEWGGVVNESGPFQPPPQPQPQAPQKRSFNPAAPSFSPSTTSQGQGQYTTSPPLPPAVPPNSMFSSTSSLSPQSPSPYQPSPNQPSPYTYGSQYQTPAHHNTPKSFTSQQATWGNNSFNTTGSYPARPQVHNTPASFPSFQMQGSPYQAQRGSPYPDTATAASASPRLQSTEMERGGSSGSGGILVGGDVNGGKGGARGRLIEFGDYPELVDTVEARERARVLRAWGDRMREVEREKRRREGGGNGNVKSATRNGEGDVGLGLDLGNAR